MINLGPINGPVGRNGLTIVTKFLKLNIVNVKMNPFLCQHDYYNYYYNILL